MSLSLYNYLTSIVFPLTESKDWHHAGKDNALLCRECRLFFKKYGEERPVDPNAEPPPFMFKPVQQDSQDLRDRNNQTVSQIKIPQPCKTTENTAKYLGRFWIYMVWKSVEAGNIWCNIYHILCLLFLCCFPPYVTKGNTKTDVKLS